MMETVLLGSFWKYAFRYAKKKDHAKSTWESAEAWYTDKLVLCVLRFIKAEENATLMKANFMGSGRKEQAVCA